MCSHIYIYLKYPVSVQRQRVWIILYIEYMRKIIKISESAQCMAIMNSLFIRWGITKFTFRAYIVQFDGYSWSSIKLYYIYIYVLASVSAYVRMCEPVCPCVCSCLFFFYKERHESNCSPSNDGKIVGQIEFLALISQPVKEKEKIWIETC